MTERKVVFPENMDTTKGLPYDSGTKKYYVDPSPLVDGSTITTKGDAPNRKITLNPRGLANFLGKALKFNTKTNKIDVNHDDTLQINGSNQLGLHPDVLNSLEDKLSDLYNKLKSEDRLLEKVEYKPNTKELWFYVGSPQKDGDETILKVNIADLIPVTSTRGIKGTGTTSNPLDIRIDPSSQGAVVTENGLKITVPEPEVDEDVNNFYLTFGNSRITLPKGLTCESFGQLPKHKWETGMSILAKRKNGQCVQLVTEDSIFQTVGLSATYGKLINSQESESVNTLTGFIEDTYFIVYTVSNSGEDTNTATTLTINQPVLAQGILNSTCEIRTKSKTANVSNPVFNANTGSWTVEIKGLEKNGQVVVLWKGKASTDRSYQIKADIKVDPTIVNRATNLTTTHTLNVNTQKNTIEIDDSTIGQAGTKDCPYINATLDGKSLVGVPYKADLKGYDFANGIKNTQANYIFDDKYYTDFTAKLTNGKNVVVLHHPFGSISSNYYVSNRNNSKGIKPINTHSVYSLFGSEADNLFEKGSKLKLKTIHPRVNNNNGSVETDYTFNPVTGNLVIPSPKEGAYYVFVRPESEECLWQLFVFVFGSTIPKAAINLPKGTITGATSSEYKQRRMFRLISENAGYYEKWANDSVVTESLSQTDDQIATYAQSSNQFTATKETPFTSTRKDFGSTVGYIQAVSSDPRYVYTETFELTLKKGKVYDITIDYGVAFKRVDYYTNEQFGAKNLTTKGELNIEALTPTKVRITTTNKTTETNDFNSNRLIIKFVD